MLYYGDMDMLFFSGLFVFSFGTIIGSFLNVLVLRLGTGEAIGRGRSRCFSCGKTLTWRELIPLVSFITQKGKCRSCGSRISWQYPIVEFITGLVFLLVALKLLHYQLAEAGLPYIGFYFFGAFAYWSAIFAILIAISVYDFRHKIIPNQLVYSFIVLAFLWGISGSGKSGNILPDVPLPEIMAGGGGFFFFSFFWVFSKREMDGFWGRETRSWHGVFAGALAHRSCGYAFFLDRPPNRGTRRALMGWWAKNTNPVRAIPCFGRVYFLVSGEFSFGNISGAFILNITKLYTAIFIWLLACGIF